MLIVTCHICGKEFKKYKRLEDPHHFCNKSCYAAYRKTLTGDKNSNWRGGMRHFTCQHCGQSFERPHNYGGKQKYCSISCKAQAQMKRGSCLQCGKALQKSSRKFCSYKCYSLYRTDHPQTFSQETRSRIAMSNRGKPGLKGRINPAYKHGLTVRTERICQVCGKQFMGLLFHQFCSAQCRHSANGKRMLQFYQTAAGKGFLSHLSCSWSGKNNPNWKHGACLIPYAPGFTLSLKKKILRRDDFCCRICNASGNHNGGLSVHHIDLGKTNHHPDNLLTVCRSCHARIHQNKISLPALS